MDIAKSNMIESSFKTIRSVAAYGMGVAPLDINLRSRKFRPLTARQICHYLCRKYTLAALEEIGEEYGQTQHGTVIHSCQSIQNRIDTDRKFAMRVEEIEMYFKYDFNSIPQL